MKQIWIFFCVRGNGSTQRSSMLFNGEENVLLIYIITKNSAVQESYCKVVIHVTNPD